MNYDKAYAWYKQPNKLHQHVLSINTKHKLAVNCGGFLLSALQAKHQLESMQYSTSVFYKSHKKHVKCLPGCNSFLRTYSSTYSISILCVHIMTPPMMKIGFMIYVLNIILPTHHRLHILEDTIWS